MALDPDVIVDALTHAEPGFQLTFGEYSPLVSAMLKKPFERIAANHQFEVVRRGPGNAAAMPNDESLYPSGRRNVAAKGFVNAMAHAYGYDIGMQTLSQTENNPDQIANLIEKYPKPAMLDFMQKIVQQIAMGDDPDITGVMTLNFEKTYTPLEGSSELGVFQPLAPDAQTGTTFGISREGVAVTGVEGWSHQYGDITGMATDGKRVMRRVYNQCTKAGLETPDTPEPDIILADQDSFENYEDLIDTDTRILSTEVTKGVPNPVASLRGGIPFRKATIHLESRFDLTGYTDANMQNGVMYFLNTRLWKGVKTTAPSAQGEGIFTWMKPIAATDRAMWKYLAYFCGNFYTPVLRNQGFVTGGATP